MDAPLVHPPEKTDHPDDNPRFSGEDILGVVSKRRALSPASGIMIYQG